MPSDIPKAKIGAISQNGLTNRFCYWQGDAGERFLFSQIEFWDLPNFTQCVVLLINEQDLQPNRQFWVGQIESLSSRIFSKVTELERQRLSVYVHLLAGSVHERQKVVHALSNQPDKAQCKLSA